MNSTNGNSQLELFEEALRGLTSKDDDDIPPASTQTTSESKENQTYHSASQQHVETINIARRHGSKRYFLVARSSLSKLRSSPGTSRSVSVVGRAAATAQTDLSFVTCTNIQGFSPN